MNRLLLALAAAFFSLTAVAAVAREPANLAPLKAQIRQYVSSGEYDRDIAKVVARAQAYLDSHLKGVDKPAIVLDIDETALSNWVQIDANDFAYVPGGACQVVPFGVCGSAAWDALERAPAVPPTLDLFNDAKARGVAIFFLTGRRQSERVVTEENLRKAGYDGWTRLILRSAADTSLTAKDYKSAERARIEAEGYHIVIDVGDQQSDLDGGSSGMTFKLPNPFYFIP